MPDCSSISKGNTVRRIVMAACVGVVGLVFTPGVHAAHDEDVRRPRVPETLEVEDGNVVFLVGHGVGTQNYVCAPSATSVTGFAFALFTPQATLLDGDRDQLTTHFFSPNNDPRVGPPEAGTIRATWEDSRDTSMVWGAIEQQSSDARFVRPDAIAWLLVNKVGAVAGPGGGDRLTKTTFIQRVNTVGGLAPSSGCSTFGDAGRKAFVPYAADYVFYKKARNR
jgi:hypothetical protein